MGWQAQKADGFKWWVQRISRSLELYDLTRIDHFRGFAGALARLHLLLKRCSLWSVNKKHYSFRDVGASGCITPCDYDCFCPGYWAVGAKEETAMNGVWKKGPAGDLFEALERVGAQARSCKRQSNSRARNVVGLTPRRQSCLGW